MSQYKLYTYFRSSASHRVRIAMHVKGLKYEPQYVHLLKDGGQQNKPQYRALNPLGTVPLLEFGNTRIAQSMAILEYLDAAHPTPALFPMQPVERAQVVAFCEIINSGIQPLQNLATLGRLGEQFQATQSDKENWVRNFMSKGLFAAEKHLEETAGQYSFGGQVTAADAFLVPQVYAAHRYKLDLSPYPLIRTVFDNCLKLDAFIKSAPENQSDFE